MRPANSAEAPKQRSENSPCNQKVHFEELKWCSLLDRHIQWVQRSIRTPLCTPMLCWSLIFKFLHLELTPQLNFYKCSKAEHLQFNAMEGVCHCYINTLFVTMATHCKHDSHDQIKAVIHLSLEDGTVGWERKFFSPQFTVFRLPSCRGLTHTVGRRGQLKSQEHKKCKMIVLQYFNYLRTDDIRDATQVSELVFQVERCSIWNLQDRT